MNIYEIRPNVADAHGCAIVAARNEREALDLMNDGNDFYRENYIDLVAIHHEELQADCNVPQIITEQIYVEQ